MHDDGHDEGPFWITIGLAAVLTLILVYVMVRTTTPAPAPDPRHSVSTFR